MPKPGDRVGEYVLESLIGGGTFGEVWKAHHHAWVHRLVAIKIPRDPAYLRNLEREGALVEKLDHPNIVKPISFDPYAPVPYLACEYVPGVNLRAIIKRRPSPERAVAILQQVLAGLGHAHAQGVVHRDLKPENVLVHESALGNGELPPGSVKIADFGLGRVASKQSDQSIAMSMDVMASTQNRAVGTLAYMAPEVQSGQPAGPQADLYACGVMLFELLTGKQPGAADLPSRVVPGLPEYLDTVYRRACSRLDDRYNTVGEMSEELASCFALALEAGSRYPREPAGAAVLQPLVTAHDHTIRGPTKARVLDDIQGKPIWDPDWDRVRSGLTDVYYGTVLIGLLPIIALVVYAAGLVLGDRSGYVASIFVVLALIISYVCIVFGIFRCTDVPKASRAGGLALAAAIAVILNVAVNVITVVAAVGGREESLGGWVSLSWLAVMILFLLFLRRLGTCFQDQSLKSGATKCLALVISFPLVLIVLTIAASLFGPVGRRWTDSTDNILVVCFLAFAALALLSMVRLLNRAIDAIDELAGRTKTGSG